MQNWITVRMSLTISSHERNGFISLQDGETTIFYPTHGGVYRKRLVSTSLTSKTVVQYTHQSKVPSEMKLFVDMMRVRGYPPYLLSP
jgi:hypothetical protein